MSGGWTHALPHLRAAAPLRQPQLARLEGPRRQRPHGRAFRGPLRPSSCDPLRPRSRGPGVRRPPRPTPTTRNVQPPEETLVSNAIAAALRPRAGSSTRSLRADPGAQAFLMLRIAFAVAPIVMGLDKFANVLTDDWTRYLAPAFNDLIPGSAADAMHIVGVVEIVAGLVVAVLPRFGGLLVAGWLAGIILNLLLVGGYGDIALRDFGLLLGALSLSRLASANFGDRTAALRR